MENHPDEAAAIHARRAPHQRDNRRTL